MKITRIEQFFPRPRVRLVKVSTDAGIDGWGETTLEGKPQSVMAAIEELSDYLLAQDIVTVRQVSPATVRRFVVSLSEAGHSPGGVTTIFTGVRAFFTWCTMRSAT